MTTIRRFCCNDLLRFASVNLDRLTVTFSTEAYMTFLGIEPQLFLVADAPGNRMMGYIMGKTEKGENWHGHITAVTFASEYRTQQLAKNLMNEVEDIFDHVDILFSEDPLFAIKKKKNFVDLNVRASNSSAIKMYEELGYVIYDRMQRFYFGEEDGLNMRKPLSVDKEKKSIIPPNTSHAPDELYTVRDDDDYHDDVANEYTKWFNLLQYL